MTPTELFDEMNAAPCIIFNDEPMFTTVDSSSQGRYIQVHYEDAFLTLWEKNVTRIISTGKVLQVSMVGFASVLFIEVMAAKRFT